MWKCFFSGSDACPPGQKCQHICENNDDSYICKCRVGYVLNPDKKTCSRKHLDLFKDDYVAYFLCSQYDTLISPLVSKVVVWESLWTSSDWLLRGMDHRFQELLKGTLQIDVFSSPSPWLMLLCKVRCGSVSFQNWMHVPRDMTASTFVPTVMTRISVCVKWDMYWMQTGKHAHVRT